MSSLFASTALLADGWARDVAIEIDGAGTIVAATANAAPPAGAEQAGGPVVPGMPNVHSHAFQRAMAGLAEVAGTPEDDFWTWRRVMYRFALGLTPPQVHAIAAQLYVELVKHGFTSVGEFHYLHNRPDGGRYADAAELSRQVIEAARRVGIALTHLPVLYGYAGFGEQPLGAAQRRFHGEPEGLLAMIARLRADYGDAPWFRIGLAPHSLRAISPATLAAAVAGLNAADPAAPIHIHIAEQVKEVEDCVAWSGQRPVEWLFANAAVDRRWCLIHATHLSDDEAARLAASSAVAGLCPTTEANLGDGVFPFRRHAAAGGRFAVGTDSHVSVSPVEELRWLEYAQRLVHRRRSIAATETGQSAGGRLWRRAAAAGAAALAQPVGTIAAGRRADLLVLDADHVHLTGKTGDQLLDALIFAGNDNLVRRVMVAGRWVVEDGHHAAEAEIAAGYRQVLAELEDA